MKSKEYECRWCPVWSECVQGISEHERYAHPKEYVQALESLRISGQHAEPSEEVKEEDAVLGVDVASELGNWIAKYGAQIELYQRKIEELRRYESDIAELRVQQGKLRRWLDELI